MKKLNFCKIWGANLLQKIPDFFIFLCRNLFSMQKSIFQLKNLMFAAFWSGNCTNPAPNLYTTGGGGSSPTTGVVVSLAIVQRGWCAAGILSNHTKRKTGREHFA